MKNRKTSSLFYRKLLRNPGQYLTEQMEEMIQRAYEYLFLPLIFLLVTIYTIFFYYRPPTDKDIFVFIIMTIGITIYSSWKVIKLFKTYRDYSLGRDGEKYVAQILHKEKEKSWRVFHDIPMSGYNIDHLIIAPQGIFCIETKSRNKGDIQEIRFDGEKLIVDGFTHYNNQPKSYLFQVAITSKNLQNSLQQITGKKFHIQAVLVFPERSVINPHGNTEKDEYWVMNPKQLPKIIRTVKTKLNSKEEGIIRNAIAKHIKEYQKEK